VTDYSEGKDVIREASGLLATSTHGPRQSISAADSRLSKLNFVLAFDATRHHGSGGGKAGEQLTRN